ncbi:MAG: DUF1275 domain-containing protein [Sphingomonadaceae bacterium]|nr:DUF1275 domain-containing protein [Sphingomonadaceae bacterium]
MLSQRPDDRVAALVLAAIAGCVDAIAWLELGGFFVSFMSGNSTRLGVALGQSQWPLARFAFGLVILFVGGVAAGNLIGERFGTRRAPVLLSIQAVLLAIAAALYGHGRYGYAPPLMALAMGIANTVFMRPDGSGVGITYMTGTLVRIGTGFARRGDPLPWLDIALWLAFVAGATAGAAADSGYGGTALEAPAIAALLLALWRWWR